MKKLIAMLLAILFLLPSSLALATGIDFSSMPDEEISAVIADAQQELFRRKAEASPEKIVLNSGGYTVEVVGVYPPKSQSQTPYAVVECVFTNSNAEPEALTSATIFEVFQNNVECMQNTLIWNKDYDWNAISTKVKNGASITAYKAISLNSQDDPIEITLCLLNGWQRAAETTFVVDLK